MLASRPPPPVVTKAALSKSKQVSKAPFVSSAGSTTILSAPPDTGVSVAAANRKKAKEAAGPTATQRHKAWLAQLQDLRTRAVAEAEEYSQLKAEEKERFMERSSALRQLLREGKWKETHVDGAKKRAARKKAIEKALSAKTQKLKKIASESKGVKAPAPSEPKQVPAAEPEPERPAPEAKKAKGATKKKLSQRPGWALTEDQYAEAKEAQEDELLDFVQGLDFEKYMEDMELRDAVEFVKKRVSEIEQEKNAIELEEQKRSAAVEQIARQEETTIKAMEAAEATPDAVDSEATAVGSGAVPTKGVSWAGAPESAPRSASSAAATSQMLKNAEAKLAMTKRTIRQVHSKNSIKAVIEKERQKRSAERSKMKAEQRYDKSAGGTDAPSASSKKKKKKAVKSGTREDQEKVQNLPYLYRHPAV